MRTDIKLTYEEYRLLPETGPRYQLVDGELLQMTAPIIWHQRMAARLFSALFLFVKERALGEVLFAPVDVILSDINVFQPDIVYVSNARKKIMVRENIRGAPDLCVEVLSPSTKKLDLKTKRLIYARYGVPELWFGDADAQTIRVFRLQEDPHRAAAIFRRKDTLTTPLLPGFTLELAEVFAE
ncbi:MAG: Uma2 family endonuclease [Planctomycetota bacterium]